MLDSGAFRQPVVGNDGDVDAELEQFAVGRGAPQVGFSRHILWIRSRTSREMTARPGRPRRYAAESRHIQLKVASVIIWCC